MEFVWLLSKYRACAKEPVQELLRTASIKKHLARHSTRVEELLAAWG